MEDAAKATALQYLKACPSLQFHVHNGFIGTCNSSHVAVGSTLKALFSTILFFLWVVLEQSEDMEKTHFSLKKVEPVDGYFVTDRYLGSITPFTTRDDRVLGQT